MLVIEMLSYKKCGVISMATCSYLQALHVKLEQISPLSTMLLGYKVREQNSPGHYPPVWKVGTMRRRRPGGTPYPCKVRRGQRPSRTLHRRLKVIPTRPKAEEGLLSGATITFTHLVSWSVVNHCDG